MGVHSANSSRFGDTPLAFNMTRFSSSSQSDGRHFWRFGVSRYCGRDPMIEIDADVATLREMERFIKAAIETVKTDGGRFTTESLSHRPKDATDD